MPFQSKSQMRYLFAKHPKLAKEFASSMNEDSIKHLPENLSDLGEKPKSVRYPSDINIKKNVEGVNSMDIDKFVRSGVLERLLEDLQELDFDKKLKPKTITIQVGGGGEGKEEMCEEEEEGMTSFLDQKDEEEDEEEMDPRLSNLLAKKRGK